MYYKGFQIDHNPKMCPSRDYDYEYYYIDKGGLKEYHPSGFTGSEVEAMMIIDAFLDKRIYEYKGYTIQYSSFLWSFKHKDYGRAREDIRCGVAKSSQEAESIIDMIEMELHLLKAESYGKIPKR